MVFQADGFYNLPAISSSIKLRRDLYIGVSVHMAVLLITSDKLITPLEPCSHSLGSPWGGFGSSGGLFPACSHWHCGAELCPSSCPWLWRWLQGQCDLCREGHRHWCFQCCLCWEEGWWKWVRASGLHRVWNLVSHNFFILIHGFSSTLLGDAKSHRGCDLEIKVLAASRQKWLQGSIRKCSCVHY